MRFDGSAMGACARMVRVKCGSPSIRVKPSSVHPEGFLVYFAEYDVSNLKSATGVFTENVEYI